MPYAASGRVGAAVAALVDGDHRVAARVQSLGDAVPETEVRGEPVDEHEGHDGSDRRRGAPT